MGATLVMVVTLAIVLGLLLFLLAELYCALLFRRRRQLGEPNEPISTVAASSTATTTNSSSQAHAHQSHDQSTTVSPSSLRSFYAHGVLRHAPRSFFFPAISDDDNFDIENRSSQLPKFLDSSSHLNGFLPISLPCSSAGVPDAGGSDVGSEHFVYISNPIYDNGSGRPTRLANTPFKTPDSSPSGLENGGYSSGDDEYEGKSEASSTSSVPLTPMKKLPAEACSVSLRDARCLRTSGSESNSNNCISSSTSGSPCTSRSW